jgi:hypothetical protein
MSISTKFYWHGEELTNVVRTAMLQRLEETGKMVADQVRHNISTLGPPASDPGQFPHIKKGDLYLSIYHKVLVSPRPQVIIGSTVPHAVFLELGTVKMSPRPFLMRTLFDMREAVKTKMTAKLKINIIRRLIGRFL